MELVCFSEEEFLKWLDEAGLSKKDFVKLAGCYENNLYNWAKKKKYPYYVKLLLETALKVKELKDNENSLNNLSNNNIELEKLMKENQALEEEIKAYEKIEELFEKTFGFKIGAKNEKLF